MSLVSYQFRIYPNASQCQSLIDHFGCARWVYNRYLSEANDCYEATGKTMRRNDFIVRLVKLKEEYPWLKDVNSQSLQMAARNADRAFVNFFEKRAKRPRFKSKHTGRQSFQCPQHCKVLFPAIGTKGHIVLPKIDPIKAILHRQFNGAVKTVTIVRDPSDKYYASVVVDDGQAALALDTIDFEHTAGIDAGIKTAFTVVSQNGAEKIDSPSFLKKNSEQLKKQQKRLSRCKRTVTFKENEKGERIKEVTVSKHYEKVRQELARTHEKIRHRRKNWIDQVTHRLVNDSQVTTYVIEDLNLKGMARAISDVGIGNFYRVLRYKLEATGKNLVVAGRWYPSSKQCPECGAKKGSLTLRERQWCCAHCGHEHDRDEAAAKNLRQRLKNTDTAGTVVRWKGKRFPFEEFPRGQSRRCGFLGERLESERLKRVARSFVL